MDYIDRLTELRIDRDVKQTKIAELLGCKRDYSTENQMPPSFRSRNTTSGWSPSSTMP